MRALPTDRLVRPWPHALPMRALPALSTNVVQLRLTT
jgi:hypothetical protein